MIKRERKDHTYVICAYKESSYLEECIVSLLEQSVKSRIIIVTSTPNKYISFFAEKYDLQVVVNTGKGGLAEDWNFAVTQADTHFVTIAHQDDVYCSNYTEDVLKALDACEHPLIAFTNYYELRNGKTVDKNRLLQIKRLLLSPLKIRLFWKIRFVRRRILSLGSAICCPSVTLVKDNLVLPIFENNMKSNVDWQAWEQISKMKGEFAYVSKPSMKHRIHLESTTSEVLKDHARIEEDLTIFRKFWPEPIARLVEHFYKKGEESNHL